MSGPAVPVLDDLMRYTVAPVVSWAILPALLQKLFAPRSVPSKFKDRFPVSLMLRPNKGGRGGKRVSHSGSSATAITLFKHPVSGSYFPRNRRSAHRAGSGSTSTSSGRPLRSSPRERCRAHGDLCRRWHHFPGDRQLGGAVANHLVTASMSKSSFHGVSGESGLDMNADKMLCRHRRG